MDLYDNKVYNTCHWGLLYIVRAPDHGNPESPQNSSHQKFNNHLGVSPPLKCGVYSENRLCWGNLTLDDEIGEDC